MFVMRHDSGDPVPVITRTLDIMEKLNVPSTTNEKGFKVWNKMRILWGDGITKEVMESILQVLKNRKYSSENMVFGSGGWLVQNHSRDTQGWAMKCSQVSITRPNEGQITKDVYKDPITAPNKKSLKGSVGTYQNRLHLELIACTEEEAYDKGYCTAMKTVFRNGAVMNEEDINSIRLRVKSYL